MMNLIILTTEFHGVGHRVSRSYSVVKKPVFKLYHYLNMIL